VVLEISLQTDRHTHTHTQTYSSQYFPTAPVGKVNNLSLSGSDGLLVNLISKTTSDKVKQKIK